MLNILKDVLSIGYSTTQELYRVKDAPFFYGALNIVYGIDGQGKSWQTAKLIGGAGSDVLKIYLDADGSNGRKFVKWCNQNDVEYVGMDHNLLGDKEWDKYSMLQKVSETIKHICKNEVSNKKQVIFVLDSLTAMGEGQEINNAEKIAPLLYSINKLCKEFGCAIILIDHATIIRDKGQFVSFKLEGSEGGKRRATASVCRFEAMDYMNPQKGGTFTVDRSRDVECFKVGSTFTVLNEVDIKEAVKWVKEKFQEDAFSDIKKSEFTKKSQHDRDKWVRKFIDDLFIITIVGRTTTYKMKIEYTLQH